MYSQRSKQYSGYFPYYKTTVSTDTENSNNNISTDLESDLSDLEVLVYSWKA